MTKKQLLILALFFVIILSITYLIPYGQLENELRHTQNQTEYIEEGLSEGLNEDLNNISKETNVNILQHDFTLLRGQVNNMSDLVSLLNIEVIQLERNVRRAERLGIDCSEEKVTLLEAKEEIVKTRILIKNSKILLEKIIERLDELMNYGKDRKINI